MVLHLLVQNVISRRDLGQHYVVQLAIYQKTDCQMTLKHMITIVLCHTIQNKNWRNQVGLCSYSCRTSLLFLQGKKMSNLLALTFDFFQIRSSVLLSFEEKKTSELLQKYLLNRKCTSLLINGKFPVASVQLHSLHKNLGVHMLKSRIFVYPILQNACYMYICTIKTR